MSVDIRLQNLRKVATLRLSFVPLCLAEPGLVFSLQVMDRQGLHQAIVVSNGC